MYTFLDFTTLYVKKTYHQAIPRVTIELVNNEASFTFFKMFYHYPDFINSFLFKSIHRRPCTFG